MKRRVAELNFSMRKYWGYLMRNSLLKPENLHKTHYILPKQFLMEAPKEDIKQRVCIW